jgi:hypothetical protein
MTARGMADLIFKHDKARMPDAFYAIMRGLCLKHKGRRRHCCEDGLQFGIKDILSMELNSARDAGLV